MEHCYGSCWQSEFWCLLTLMAVLLETSKLQASPHSMRDFSSPLLSLAVICVTTISNMARKGFVSSEKIQASIQGGKNRNHRGPLLLTCSQAHFQLPCLYSLGSPALELYCLRRSGPPIPISNQGSPFMYTPKDRIEAFPQLRFPLPRYIMA